MRHNNEYLNNKYLEGLISRFQKAKSDKSKYEFIIANLNANIEQEESLEISLGKYKRNQAEFLELQSLLADAFFTLADNLARYAKFNYIDIDDAIQEGV